jgi:hypothetical protein
MTGEVVIPCSLPATTRARRSSAKLWATISATPPDDLDPGSPASVIVDRLTELVVA